MVVAACGSIRALPGPSTWRDETRITMRAACLHRRDLGPLCAEAVWKRIFSGLPGAELLRW
jgi:hypothetical protein